MSKSPDGILHAEEGIVQREKRSAINYLFLLRERSCSPWTDFLLVGDIEEHHVAGMRCVGIIDIATEAKNGDAVFFWKTHRAML